jgi:putative spermidine/putrescine transport system ATP-binding protein
METARSLSLKSVTKSYLPGQNAVDAIDLDVAPGEFISFLGPSGSGKTTTLMMIAGFARPTRGEISIAGRQIDAVEPYDRNIGMVFQNYALFPHMNAAENVGFPLRMRGVAKALAQAKVAAALAMVGLADYAGRAPAELSGGQQQRVALARALVFQPDLVLLDEPLGALDKTLREQMQMELKRIHRELGVTMIYVTHDQTEAMAMSDRIAVFNRGRIEQIGTPSEVYFTPKTRFVASFVGDSNLFSGKTREDGLVDVDGFGTVATSARHISPGKDISVLVRPETVRLSSERAGASPLRNSITVEELVNYGDSVLVLGSKAGQELRIRVPSMDMPNLRRGDECGVEWTPTRIHVIEH